MWDGEPIVDVVEDRLGARGEPLSDLVRPHRRTGEVVAVVGAPGMGKSAVLRSVARQGEVTGYRVLSDAVTDDGTAVFDRLAAILREADDDASTPLSHLLDRASARRPHLVVVDDVHLLPEPALAELTEISRRLAGQPVLFVLSCDPRTATRLPAEITRRTLRPLGPASAAVLLRRQPTVVAG